MKLAVLAVFLLVAAVMSLPVEQPKGKAVAVEASPERAQKQEADDLKAEETFWGGWGGHYGRHYGGWGGGYYAPHYYNSGWGGYGWGGHGWHGYPTTYYTSYWG